LRHNINTKLKARILERFGSQTDFSEEVGQHESFISKVVRNRREPSQETKEHWASILNCEVKDIFCKD
jgi:transcriptional regulator with XRE-family HTH domain